jgi:hypothetical protein
MILPVSVLVLALSVPLTGGRLSRLSELRIRWTSTIIVALLLQIWVTTIPTDPTLGTVVHLVSYALGAVFIVANRHVPGLLLTASGGAMNLAAIAANGGVMPASEAALEGAGMGAQVEHFVNSGAVEDARLWWLGDVFYIPEAWPLSNVFSVGDIVLLLGIGMLLHRASRGHGLPQPVDADDKTPAPEPA